jgi:hypothetical protein
MRIRISGWRVRAIAVEKQLRRKLQEQLSH